MANIQFIDLNYFYVTSGVNRNIDAKRIRQWITKAQDINVKTLIGEDLFSKISSDIDNSTLTGYYLTLTNTYLAPIISGWAKYYFSLNNIELTNKGMQEKKSEFSDSPDLQKQEQTQSMLELDLNQKEKECMKYILDNISEFPEYEDSCNRRINPYTRNMGLY